MSLPHDRVGRLVLEYLRGVAGCGLPPAAAFLAFGKHHHLDAATLATVRQVLVLVEGAEGRRAA